MNLLECVELVEETKENSKNALIEKGLEIDENFKLSQVDEKIVEIQAGDSSKWGCVEKVVYKYWEQRYENGMYNYYPASRELKPGEGLSILMYTESNENKLPYELEFTLKEEADPWMTNLGTDNPIDYIEGQSDYSFYEKFTLKFPNQGEYLFCFILRDQHGPYKNEPDDYFIIYAYDQRLLFPNGIRSPLIKKLEFYNKNDNKWVSVNKRSINMGFYRIEDFSLSADEDGKSIKIELSKNNINLYESRYFKDFYVGFLKADGTFIEFTKTSESQNDYNWYYDGKEILANDTGIIVIVIKSQNGSNPIVFGQSVFLKVNNI